MRVLRSIFLLILGSRPRRSVMGLGVMIWAGVSLGLPVEDLPIDPQDLGEVQSSPIEGEYLATLGERLAQAARSNGAGRYSSSRCYQFVWADLRQVLGGDIDSTSVPSQSAYQFGDWADRNPGELASTFKLRKVNLYPEVAPLGSVIVWNPGDTLRCRSTQPPGSD